MESNPRTRAGSGRGLVGILVAVVALIWLVWWQWGAIQERFGGNPSEESGEEIRRAEDASSTGVDAAPTTGEVSGGSPEGPWETLLGIPAEWPEDLGADVDCASAQEDLERLGDILDSRPYVAAAGVEGGARALIEEAAAALSARKPRPGSELRDHAAMLGNVFHLFRALGADRVDLARRIVREEESLAEPAALILYRWAASRESCGSGAGRSAAGRELYEYASWMFQTLGGQAYLRRRSPRVEGLASFYALLALDRAVDAGRNPYGIDPRPEIRRTRELLGGQSLQFNERYRSLLAEMERKWERRASTESGDAR